MIKNGFVCELDHFAAAELREVRRGLRQGPTYGPGQQALRGLADRVFTASPTTRSTSTADHVLPGPPRPGVRGRVGLMSDNTEWAPSDSSPTGSTPRPRPRPTGGRPGLLRKLRPSVTGFYDQSYINKLENGDTWITQAWSGDVFQAQQSGFEHLEFVTPEEGQMMWHDNLMIPRQAANPVSALAWMDFYYTPKIAGSSRTTSTTCAPSPVPRTTCATSSRTPPSPTARSCSRRRTSSSAPTSSGCSRNYDEYSSGTASSTRWCSRDRGRDRRDRGVGTGPGRRRLRVPFLLGIVGTAYLCVFFVIPLVSGLIVSLMSGNPDDGTTFTWNVGIYSSLFVDPQVPYLTFLLRSLWYGVAATIVTILVGTRWRTSSRSGCRRGGRTRCSCWSSSASWCRS